MIKKIVLTIGLFISLNSFASNTLTGLWVTTDHKTKKSSSIVKITRSGHNFSGSIVKIFEENGHLSSDLCKKCKGEESAQQEEVTGKQNVNNCKWVEYQFGRFKQEAAPKNSCLYKTWRVILVSQQTNYSGLNQGSYSI